MLKDDRINTTWNENGKTISEIAQVDNRDYVAYDLTRPKRGWSGMDEAPFIAFTFLAWSALRRAGKTALKLDEFLTECPKAEPLNAEEVDPTPAGTAPA